MQSKRYLMISRNGIILFLYAFVMFFPGDFSGPFVNLLDNIFFVIAIALLFISKYRPSKFVVMMFIYFSYLAIVSFCNGLPNADIHMIISYMKMIIFIAFVEKHILKKSKETINLLLMVLGVLVFVDFFSLIIFPEGLYTKTMEWNEWSTSDVRHWFFGNKNNRVYWYMLVQLLLYFKCKIYNEQRNRHRLLLFSMIAIVGMLLSESSTAIVVITISTIGFLIGVYKKKPIRLNIYIVVAIYMILWTMIVSGATGFMDNIIQTIFRKDTTFTGRVSIWETVLLSITQKPIFGWGYISGNVAAELMDNLSFTSAHNQILNTLWHGGICLFSILVYLVGLVLKRIHCLKEKNMEATLALSLFALLLDMIFESILNVQATWMFLFLCYITTTVLAKQKGERL